MDAVATRRRLFASLPSPLLPPLPHSVQAQTPRLALSLPTMLVSVSLPLPPLVPLRLAPSPSQPASPERRVPPHDTRARAPPRPRTAPRAPTNSPSGTAHAPGAQIWRGWTDGGARPGSPPDALTRRPRPCAPSSRCRQAVYRHSTHLRAVHARSSGGRTSSRPTRPVRVWAQESAARL